MIYNINFSTWITLLRIFLTPCVILAIYHQMIILGGILFLCASFTDFLDGYFARLYAQESELGKILDPVADKFLLIGTLSALHFFYADDVIPRWFLFFLWIKDALLLGVGGYILHHNYKIIAPSGLSKFATTLSMLCVLYALCVILNVVSPLLLLPLIYVVSLTMILILYDYGCAIIRLQKL